MSFNFLRCHPPLNLNTANFLWVHVRYSMGNQKVLVFQHCEEDEGFLAHWLSPQISLPWYHHTKTTKATPTSNLTFLMYQDGGKGFCTWISLILSKTCCRLKSHLADLLPSAFRISGRSYFKNWWEVYQEALLESCMCLSSSTCMYTGQRFHNCHEFSVCAVPDGDSSVGITGSWPALRSKPLIQ